MKKLLLILIIFLFILGCQEIYVIPEEECPKTDYLIENADDLEPLSVSGVLRLSSDMFNDPEMKGHSIFSKGIYYDIGTKWDDQHITKEEAIKKLNNLVGKKIKLNGQGFIIKENNYAWMAIESCN